MTPQQLGFLYPALRPHERAAINRYITEVETSEGTCLSWSAIRRLRDALDPPACSPDATAYLLDPCLDLLELIHGDEP